jgi:succinoglycan biosynthesis transport protein ExoP
MNVLLIKRILRRKWIWLLLLPVISAGTVFYSTRDMQRDYVTDATIYTGLASGYSITSSEDSRLDNYAVNNAFDNLITTIKSGETIEDVSMHLLASHLVLTKPDPYTLNKKGFAALAELVDKKHRAQIVVPRNEGATYERIRQMVKRPENNLFKKILYDSKSNYDIDGITSRLTVVRKNSSDMLELSFKADDPAICQHTLAVLIDVFRQRYTHVKSSETTNVVRYFENQVKRSYQSLQGAENTLKNFGVDNKIINYGEQSKFVAESKEDMTTQYNQEMMRFRASKAALTTLEKRLSSRLTVVTTNDDILARRNELAKLQTQLANATIFGQPAAVIERLQGLFQQQSDELRQVARTYYNTNNTQEGLPQGDVLNEWLTKLLEYEESAARIVVIEKRLKEYDAIYTEFAPLGSTMNRMEREVGVAEKEYLSVLHGLNLARLRQKNLEMSGPLTVLDAPKFPLSPQPSKRMVLILASFLAGFVLSFATLLTVELLTKGLRTPEQAEEKIGLSLAAAFPLVAKTKNPELLQRVEAGMVEQLRSVILIETLASVRTNPYDLIVLFSTQTGGRASWVGEHICRRMAQAGHAVAYLSPHAALPTDGNDPASVAWGTYPVTSDFADTQQIDCLLEKAGLAAASSYSFVFLELPALRETAIPAYLVARANLSLLIVDASLSWARTDSVLVQLYQKASKSRLMMVVDRVEPDLLEPLLGPIARPTKKRGKKGLPVQVSLPATTVS